jgi:type IV pilus assembly protein PilA
MCCYRFKGDHVTRREPEQGFSLIELLIVIAIILIIITVALPQMSKMRMNANEMRAIAEIQTIQKAETQYNSQFGRPATSMTELGPPSAAGAAEGPNSAGLIPANLASGSDSAYNFTLTESPTGYSITAVPKSFNSTGRRTFYSDQTMTIHQNWGQEPATAQSPELK